MKNTVLRRQFKDLKTMHVLHFFLTILTGIWLLVWIAVTMSNQSKRIELLLDACEDIQG